MFFCSFSFNNLKYKSFFCHVFKYISTTIVVILFLQACSSSNTKTSADYGPTLADLAPVSVPIKSDEEMAAAVAKVDIEEIERNYRSALEAAKDPNVRHRILIRLGDLEMASSEIEQVESEQPQNAYFNDAISMYEELIDLNAARQGEPDTPSNERLLYQLSKAYALDGRIEESDGALQKLAEQFPESAYAAESDFRRAELAFSENKYEEAEVLYAKVIAVGEATPFYGNAVYMHGWSQFKQNDYRRSIKSFTEVLDRTLIEGQKLDQLSGSELSIAKDTLRVISIVFSYLDGPQTIEEVYVSMGARHYEHLLYRSLGDLYLEQERFRDSADTYRHYVKVYPSNDLAPAFSGRAIEVYQQGDFPSLILPAKEEYVTNYGAYSPFWQERSADQRAPIIPYLKTYLTELSSFFHAEAQALDSANMAYEKKLASGKRLDPVKDKKPESAKPNYLKAAKLYGEFVFTFSQDSKVSEMIFLQGEAYFSAESYAQSVRSYEIVAYEIRDEKFGADAAYSALLALDELIKSDQSYLQGIPVYSSEHSIYKGDVADVYLDRDAPQSIEDTQLENQQAGITLAENANVIFEATWQSHKLNSSFLFSDFYRNDSRAAPVLAKTAQDLFQNKQLSLAAETAERLTQWQPNLSKDLQKTSWLVLAHSLFDLQDFDQSETAYRELYVRLDKDDSDRSAISDRIAASVYKQAELQVAADDLLGAIDKLLSIRELAPGSDIAISGQYDAANYLIELQDWARAEQVLLDFKQRYPNHKLSSGLAPKFALIYQESEQWGKAASALEEMAQNETDPEAQRQSQYLSAELYEKSGDKPAAILQYTRYADKYPQPFDLATEARFRLVELYQEANNSKQENVWLRQLIASHNQAGSNATDRSRYLAASAEMKFANDDFSYFSSVPLTAPLKKSLAIKKNALDTTLSSYKRVMNYSVAEFTTQANNKIGNIYGQLSKDLMSSERPKGLDELALEQYEILLEEQAFPFEEKAIEIHTANSRRAWDGIYDDWVKKSFAALADLLPARFGKKETKVEVSDVLY